MKQYLQFNYYFKSVNNIFFNLNNTTFVEFDEILLKDHN